MNYNISDIRCPICGDRSKSPPNYAGVVKCKNCKSEYYVDNNGIAQTDINKAYSTPPPNPYQSESNDSPSYKERKHRFNWNYIIGGIILAIIFVIVILIAGRYVSKYLIRDYNVRYHGNYNIPLPDVDETLHVLSISLLEHEDKPLSGYYYSFIDISSNTIVARGKLDNVSNTEHPNYRFFSSNQILFIIDNKKVFEVDTENKEVYDVTNSLIKQNDRRISVGISSIEFLDYTRGEGFLIKNKEGEEFCYYPFSQDPFSEAPDIDWNVNGQDTVYYAFSNNTNAELLRIKAKYDCKGLPKPLLVKTYMSAESENDFIPFEKNKYVSYKNITPGRTYNEPRILYYDSNNLLIKYNATSKKGSQSIIESIDVRTGKRKWSKDIDFNPYYFKQELSGYSNGKYFVKTSYLTYLIIDKKGNFNYYHLPPYL